MMKKFVSISYKVFNSVAELFLALAVCFAILFSIFIGLYELLAFTCQAFGYSESLCLNF